MKDQSRIFFLVFGGICFLMSVVHLVRFFQQPSDIWWTPTGIRVPLSKSSDRAEIYVAGVLLPAQLKAGHLLLAGEQGTARLDETAISLRFNNWDRVRSEQIPVLLSFAVGAGSGGVILLFGALGWTPRRATGASTRGPAAETPAC